MAQGSAERSGRRWRAVVPWVLGVALVALIGGVLAAALSSEPEDRDVGGVVVVSPTPDPASPTPDPSGEPTPSRR